jgi:hypothetical protein
MSSRTAAARLENLIEEASALEQLGKPIQEDDEDSALRAAAELERRYRIEGELRQQCERAPARQFCLVHQCRHDHVLHFR